MRVRDRVVVRVRVSACVMVYLVVYSMYDSFTFIDLVDTATATRPRQDLAAPVPGSGSG